MASPATPGRVEECVSTDANETCQEGDKLYYCPSHTNCGCLAEDFTLSTLRYYCHISLVLGYISCYYNLVVDELKEQSQTGFRTCMPKLEVLDDRPLHRNHTG